MKETQGKQEVVTIINNYVTKLNKDSEEVVNEFTLISFRNHFIYKDFSI